jgi:hypothetical protein
MNDEPENTEAEEDETTSLTASEANEVVKKKKKKKKKKKIRVSSLLTHGNSTRSFLRTRGDHEHGREDGLDPNYEYRYIRKTAVDVGRRYDEGWDLVDNSDKSIVGPNHDKDTTVNTHDLVLARMPKEMHNKVKLVAGAISRQSITGAMNFDGSEDDGKTGISFAEDQ